LEKNLPRADFDSLSAELLEAAIFIAGSPEHKAMVGFSKDFDEHGRGFETTSTESALFKKLS